MYLIYKLMEETDFLHAGANSGKPKVISLILGLAWSKMGMVIYLVYENRKPAVSLEWVYDLSWFFACWLWCNNFWFNQHCTLSLIFKCQSTAVVLLRPLVVAGRILWNRVCPSFNPAICLSRWFLGIGSLDLKFCTTEPKILKNIFLLQKLG